MPDALSDHGPEHRVVFTRLPIHQLNRNKASRQEGLKLSALAGLQLSFTRVLKRFWQQFVADLWLPLASHSSDAGHDSSTKRLAY